MLRIDVTVTVVYFMTWASNIRERIMVRYHQTRCIKIMLLILREGLQYVDIVYFVATNA